MMWLLTYCHGHPQRVHIKVNKRESTKLSYMFWSGQCEDAPPKVGGLPPLKREPQNCLFLVALQRFKREYICNKMRYIQTENGFSTAKVFLQELQRAASGLKYRTQTMPTVSGIRQTAFSCASQHALALLAVRDSTGISVRESATSVGWVGTGQVHKAESRASLILYSMEVVHTD